MNFDAALSRQPWDAVSPGAKKPSGLPFERCVGRSFNLCKPLDDARLKMMLGFGVIRRRKKREMLFCAGDPMGAFFKIRSGVVGGVAQPG